MKNCIDKEEGQQGFNGQRVIRKLLCQNPRRLRGTKSLSTDSTYCRIQGKGSQNGASKLSDPVDNNIAPFYCSVQSKTKCNGGINMCAGNMSKRIRKHCQSQAMSKGNSQ